VLSAFRFLLIDGNEHERALTERELQRRLPGCVATCVGTKTGPARALKSSRFHLAITDYRLPWSDGLALYRHNRERDPECPVILYTGSGSSETAAHALGAVVDDYVVKSVEHLPQILASARLDLERRTQERPVNDRGRFLHLVQTLPIGVWWVAPGEHLLNAQTAHSRIPGCPDRDSLLAAKDIRLFENQKAVKDRHQSLREKQSWKAWKSGCGGKTDRWSGAGFS
jgi:DNA-binding response OmpR family regulator